MARCLAAGDCVCHAHDFHGDESHEADLEIFLPLSIAWTNQAPTDSGWSVEITQAPVQNEAWNGFTSRTDFTAKHLTITDSSTNGAATSALAASSGVSIALKFMHVWDSEGEMGGTLFAGASSFKSGNGTRTI